MVHLCADQRRAPSGQQSPNAEMLNWDDPVRSDNLRIEDQYISRPKQLEVVTYHKQRYFHGLEIDHVIERRERSLHSIKKDVPP